MGKRLLILIGFLLSYFAGLLTYRIYNVQPAQELSHQTRDLASSTIDLCKTSREDKYIDRLNATVDTFHLILRVNGSTDISEKVLRKYSEDIVTRMEDVRSTISDGGTYSNQYRVDQSFSRAERLIETFQKLARNGA